tara:strand:+ start:633 stop:1070 length:438 start_codon:yes stop_codon:yes gene_type:complete
MQDSWKPILKKVTSKWLKQVNINKMLREAVRDWSQDFKSGDVVQLPEDIFNPTRENRLFREIYSRKLRDAVEPLLIASDPILYDDDALVARRSKQVTSSYLTAKFELPMHGLRNVIIRHMSQMGWVSSNVRDLESRRKIPTWRKT